MSLTSPALPCSYSYLAGANGGTTALVSSITYSGKSTAAYSYTYDARGNITAVYKGGTLQASYVYDDLNQLVRENNVTANKTWVYTYDERGNILSKDTYAYTTGTLGAVEDSQPYWYYDQWSTDVWGRPISSSAISGWNEILLSDTYLCFCCFNATKSRGTMVL